MMRVPELPCLSKATPDARDVYLAASGEDMASLLGDSYAYLRDRHQEFGVGSLLLVPGITGVKRAVFVYDPRSRDPAQFGALATGLPHGVWKLSTKMSMGRESHVRLADALLGFCMGAYKYSLGPKRGFDTKLTVPDGVEASVDIARAIWLGRDLINAPANSLGPEELAHAAEGVLQSVGAQVQRVYGSKLETAYPSLAAVGAGSSRAAQVVVASWAGSGARTESPLFSLVGKGVCFDSGGYDIKPAGSMFAMKKDMGGAALMLALAYLMMKRDLPLRLEVRLGCVENSISGHAMRPGDILKTRAGLMVEVGNTDAEGRLVLADLLSEACESDPTYLIDAATLTGAARTALGPDLPALFTNDERLGSILLEQAHAQGDAMWRLPLWEPYDVWLDRPHTHMSSVAEKPFAGAIVAALFLKRFVRPSVKWAHIDTYAWSDGSRPGHPSGGETLGLRALVAAVQTLVDLPPI